MTTEVGWPATLVEIAKERIKAKTVSITRYGTRVECRPEFGDDRVDAKAYWLGTTADPVRCRCWQANANDGMCSHRIAARIYETETLVSINPFAEVWS